MGQNFNNFEDFFRQGLNNHSIEPSAKVLRSLKFKLWKTDFFSLNLRKFNFIYALALISTIAILINLISHKSKTVSEFSSGKSDINNTSGIASANVPLPSSVSVNDQPEISQIKNTDDAGSLPFSFFEPSTFEGCAPLYIRFLNKSKNADSYQWDFGNGESSNVKNPEVVFKSPGTYEVVLHSKAHSKKSGIMKKIIHVSPQPKAIAEIDMENSDIGLKQIAFKNNSKSAVSCIWNFGDNTTSHEFNATHTYKNFGTYKVKLTVFDEYGCSDTVLIDNKFLSKNYELSFPVNFRPSTLGSDNNGYYEKAGQDKFVFYPLNNGVQEYELKIIAPNGIVVFTSNNIKQGWNGYIKGRLAPGGAYTYAAKGIYPNGKRFDLKGTFNVIVVDINGYY